jgi:NAD-reducing hydrogenase large subunit
MDSDPAARNVVGLLEKHPDIAKDGIALRKFGQQAIERLAGERIHPSWTVPGGVNKPLDVEARDTILSELPLARSILRRTVKRFKGMLDGFDEEIAHFGTAPTMYAGLVSPDGALRLYDGVLRMKDAAGAVVANVVDPLGYADVIGEAALADSYLKAPYYKPSGYPEGIYRVGPLGRLNVADRCGTEDADVEFAEYHQRFGPVVESSFNFHYARLIEATYALERMEQLLQDPDILSTHVRATADVNALEGVGIIEAPRGTLIHHYKVDERGAITYANLIVATGHNNLAIGKSVEQVSKRFVDGAKLQEGMLNRVQAVVRAYDPCLSCSTHASGVPQVQVDLVASDGTVLDTVRS